MISAEQCTTLRGRTQAPSTFLDVHLRDSTTQLRGLHTGVLQRRKHLEADCTWLNPSAHPMFSATAVEASTDET
ncbi:hypothetical protein IG631_09220 [Alternaria alternata]|nr:hypothetical protein IG631_09220 [Alternaria alternata]